VKRGLKRIFRDYGQSLGALLLMGMVVIAFSFFAHTSVSAGQAVAAGPHDDHPEFPAGEGRDAVMRLCVKCHSPNIILANGQTRQGWENTITKMARLGAVGTDDDFSDVADYLTANFPPSTIQKVFVNMATDKQLAALLDISMEDAKAIIAYRDNLKGFKSIDEMKQVPNVDAKKIDAKKDNLVFGFLNAPAK
jgi:competence protein ComEA